MRRVRAPAHGGAIPKRAGGSRRANWTGWSTLQARLLGMAAQLLKPGGTLTYVTCSLLDEEGADQIDGFLAANRGWLVQTPALPLGSARGEGVRLSPAHDATDGFFIACISKP